MFISDLCAKYFIVILTKEIKAEAKYVGNFIKFLCGHLYEYYGFKWLLIMKKNKQTFIVGRKNKSVPALVHSLFVNIGNKNSGTLNPKVI